VTDRRIGSSKNVC